MAESKFFFITLKIHFFHWPILRCPEKMDAQTRALSNATHPGELESGLFDPNICSEQEVVDARSHASTRHISRFHTAYIHLDMLPDFLEVKKCQKKVSFDHNRARIRRLDNP